MIKNLFTFFKYNKSISENLIYRTITAISLVFIILITANFFYSFKNSQNEISKRGVLLHNTCATVISYPVWTIDKEEIERVIRKYLALEEVSLIKLTFENETLVFKDEDYSNNYIIPLTKDLIYNDQKIGTLSMEITYGYLFKRFLFNLLYNLMVLFSIIAVVIYLIRNLIKTHLETPLTTLINNINIIAAGDYSHVLPPAERSELNSITTTINSMSTQVSLRDSLLKSAKRFLKNIIESMPSAVIVVNEKGDIIQYNLSALTLMRIISADSILNTDEAVGRKFWKTIPFLERYLEHVPFVSSKHQPLRFTSVSVDIDTHRYFNITLFPLLNEETPGMVIAIDDVTELTQKEMQMQQIQKMETIGTLAGGLAHDFNNVLGGITGSISLLKFKIDNKEPVDDESLNEFIELMNESSSRATDMVQQLLTLSRKKELTYAPVDLNESVKHVLKICNSSFDKSVPINPHYMEGRAMVNADPTHLEQVLLNLCINANHAMTIMRKEEDPQGGSLTISIEKIESDQHFISSHPEATDQDYWIVSVSDTGVGIDQKNLTKIFDPFFTTKTKEKGTGLGLAMVYNIVKQHDGFVDVYSEVGRGSTFNVYLPIMKREVAEVEQTNEPNIYYGSGLILVIDDDHTTQKIAEAILEECGYTVTIAENGEQGVIIYKDHSSEITGVLLDLVMPKKSGENTYEELKEINPDVKVLLASGFRHDQRVDYALSLGINGFIQKPFTLKRLSKAVYEMLQKKERE